MSMGYCGYADLQDSDETMVVYLYCCYNANDDYERFMQIEDGELYIERDAFVEPEIHEKIKKSPSGRKRLIEKRIKKDIPFGDLLNSGKIKVKNASGTWKTLAYGIDFMAYNILFKLFDEYQETGVLPDHISWYS
ncbi:hypothetical protein SAMN02745687_01218 [Lachnospiraceae bacterium NK3A20]|nr:hypothetical protein SAMN02745687_01218 [Lachnospiraceae bacterium NK3A20]